MGQHHTLLSSWLLLPGNGSGRSGGPSPPSTPPSPRNPKPMAGRPGPTKGGAVRSRPQDATDGPMRRLPVSARRYMYAGVAPGAASLARSPLSSLCAHRNGNATPTQGRKEEGKAGADCPHHPQERRGAGGGGRRKTPAVAAP